MLFDGKRMVRLATLRCAYLFRRLLQRYLCCVLAFPDHVRTSPQSGAKPYGSLNSLVDFQAAPLLIPILHNTTIPRSTSQPHLFTSNFSVLSSHRNSHRWLLPIDGRRNGDLLTNQVYELGRWLRLADGTCCVRSISRITRSGIDQ